MTDNEEFFTDTQKFNCRGNTKRGKFSVFWSAAAWVIEMDTGTGAHKRLHAAPDEETTNKVLYTPNVLSVQELMDEVQELRTKIDGKK